MPLWSIADILLKARQLEQETQQKKAAEETAKDEVERPPYSPDEEQEINQLLSEPVKESEIDGTVVTNHFDRFVDSRNPEQLKAFARLLLKHGFDLPKERANQLAELVAQNKDRLKGSFYGSGLRDVVADKLAAYKKESAERSVTNVILSNPKKFVDIFNGFYKRPPGGKPFLSEEEWARGHQPPKRRSGPSTI